MRLLAVGAIVWIGCGAVPSPLAPTPVLVASEPADLIPADVYNRRVASLRATLARSHIALDTTPVIEVCGMHHGIDDCARCEVASRLDTADVDPDMIDAVAIAFAHYSSKVLIAAKLEHVALCRRIRYAHDHGDGADPAGMAIWQDARLLVSIEFFSNKTHEHYGDFTIEQVVHHELFHMIDRATLGEKAYADREWHALNPPSFTYTDPAPAQPARPPGFVNGYATTNELEDRASVFEYLMGQPAKLCAIAELDPIVAAKARMVWGLVAKLMGPDRLPDEAACLTRKPGKPGKPVKPATRKGKPSLKLPVPKPRLDHMR
jgi:hypothetical protein